MHQFKVLLVYPNLMMVTQLPNNIALLSACLKKAGIQVKVFDSTLYKTSEETVDDARVRRLQVRPFNIKEKGVQLKKKNIFEAFSNEVKKYNPDLIGVSVLDDTVSLGLALIKSLDNNRPPTIFGGVYAMFNYLDLIKEKEVDYICIGEGDDTFCEVCHSINFSYSAKDINNLCFKESGNIIVTPLKRPVDINSLPFEDYSVFEKHRIYRPMQGKLVASIPLLFDRGCPYSCSFCNAPSISKLYKDQGYKYYRQKTIDRIEKEIQYQLDKNPDISYFYFNSETFLSRNVDFLKKFVKMYKKYNLPFWCQTRIETITDEKIKLLSEINCDRISIGLEHGNEGFRNKVLNKKFSNDQVIKSFKILNKYNLKISVNNILGFPGETRDLIFDTIELNRKLEYDSVNGFVFQPYRGTSLRDLCIEKRYLKDLSKVDNLIGDSILDLPTISQEELKGLLKTFVLYIKLPKHLYNQILIAEKDTEEGKKVFEKLKKELYKFYFKD